MARRSVSAATRRSLDAKQTASASPIVRQAVQAFRAGRFSEAETGFRRALQINPTHADALHGLGLLARRAGDLYTALDLFQRAEKSGPKAPEYLVSVAGAELGLGRRDEAVKTLSRALARRPEDPHLALRLADAKSRAGRFEQAVEDFDAVAEGREPLTPEAQIARAGAAVALERLDRQAEAIERLQPVLDASSSAGEPAPLIVVAAFARSAAAAERADEALDLVRAADEDYQRRLEAAAPGTPEPTLPNRGPNADANDLAQAWNAAARILESRSEFDAAFDAFARANDLLPHTWDARAFEHSIDERIRAYSPETIRTLSRSRSTDQRPLLIVGMPRSGTTLVERMLAAHPSVRAAGELRDLQCVERALFLRVAGGRGSEAWVRDLKSALADQGAEWYLKHLRRLGGAKKRVTDKMPMNALRLGLLWQLVPNARVIWCRRDPVDTCWSCFSTTFTDDIAFTRDLRALGVVHRSVERLMQHWQTALDLPIFDLRYEDLVTEPEPVARAMLDFAGLDWNDAVLRHHEVEGPVLTASEKQAVRPIYRSAIGRSKPYTHRLGPLLDELGVDAPSSGS
jgi:tetratricopeptide (TPR) repeat protein